MDAAVFLFDTLPHLFFTILSTLNDVVVFMFDDFSFEILGTTYSWTPIGVFFGAGIGVIAGFIILKFVV